MGLKAKIAAGLISVAFLAGCDNKPEHYLVLCYQTDGNGWNLIDTVKKDGYIMSCTYQSPDKLNSYSRVCDKTGCNITK